jgi:hypothetical protein
MSSGSSCGWQSKTVVGPLISYIGRTCRVIPLAHYASSSQKLWIISCLPAWSVVRCDLNVCEEVDVITYPR